MIDTTKLLNQFNEAAKNLRQNDIDNLGKQILELGTKEYPVSILAAVENKVNNNGKSFIDYQAIYEVMGDDDKSVIRKLSPKMGAKGCGNGILGKNYRTFNKKEDNIKRMWLGKPNELFLKCDNNFTPRLYQQQLGTQNKARSLVIDSLKYAGDGKKVIGVRLMNELTPVFIWTQQINSNLHEELGGNLEFIPLPSILENGTHYSELVSYGQKTNSLEALHDYHREIFGGKSTTKINNINIFPQSGDSICTQLNSDWCTWLEQLQGITINDKQTWDNKKISLNLEEYTYPTFWILLRGCEVVRNNNELHKRDILICDSSTYTPLFNYCIVGNREAHKMKYQTTNQYPNCRSDEGIEYETCDNMPICIHTNMLKPANQEKICVQGNHDVQIAIDIEEDDINDIRIFLFTLMNQKGINVKKILLCSGVNKATKLREELASDFNLSDIDYCYYSELKKKIDPNHIVIFCSQCIIFEREDAINRLASKFKSDLVGSVSCKITYIDIDSEKMKEKKSSSGQMMKKKKYSENEDSIEIESENSFNQIHGTHFNVIANNYDCTLIKGRDIIQSDLNIDDIKMFICKLTLNFAMGSRINTVDTNIRVYCTSQEIVNSKHWLDVNKTKLLSENWKTYADRVSHEIQLLP